MKYKVSLEHPLGKKMAKVIDRIKKAEQAALDFCKEEFGADKVSVGGHTHWGGICAVKFDEKPFGWKHVGKKWQRLFMPRVNQKEIWEKIKKLPIVDHREFSSLLGWDGLQVVGMTVVRHPGFCKVDGYVLVEVPEKMNQKEIYGMEEITTGEYKELIQA